MLLVPVVYFAEPVKTSLWAIWAEQHAKYTCTQTQKTNVQVKNKIRSTNPETPKDQLFINTLFRTFKFWVLTVIDCPKIAGAKGL